MSHDYDLDPAALAWARQKIQRHIDKLDAWHAEVAVRLADADIEKARRWREIAFYMRRAFIGGEGCVIAAFDERLPKVKNAIEAPRRAGEHR